MDHFRPFWASEHGFDPFLANFGVCGHGYEPFLANLGGSRHGYGPSRMFGIDMGHFGPISGVLGYFWPILAILGIWPMLGLFQLLTMDLIHFLANFGVSQN